MDDLDLLRDDLRAAQRARLAAGRLSGPELTVLRLAVDQGVFRDGQGGWVSTHTDHAEALITAGYARTVLDITGDVVLSPTPAGEDALDRYRPALTSGYTQPEPVEVDPPRVWRGPLAGLLLVASMASFAIGVLTGVLSAL